MFHRKPLTYVRRARSLIGWRQIRRANTRLSVPLHQRYCWWMKLLMRVGDIPLASTTGR